MVSASATLPALGPEPAAPRRWPRLRRSVVLIAVLLAAVLAGLRIAAPGVARWALLRWLNTQQGVHAELADVRLSVLRAQCRLSGLVVERLDRSGRPTLRAQATEITADLHWRALLALRVEGEAVVTRPRVTVLPVPGASPKEEAERQRREVRGATAPAWCGGIHVPVPVRLTRVRVSDGVVAWLRSGQRPDLVVRDLEATVRELDSRAGLAPCEFQGTIDNGGRVDGRGRVDVFAPAAAADLEVVIRRFPIERINELLQQKAGIDVEKGTVDAVMRLTLRDGVVSGSAKPLVAGLDVFDLRKDIMGKGVIGTLREAAAAGAAKVAQGGNGEITAEVPISADLNQPGVDLEHEISGAVGSAMAGALRHSVGGGAPPAGPQREARFGAAWRSGGGEVFTLQTLEQRGTGFRVGGGLAWHRESERNAFMLEGEAALRLNYGRVAIEVAPALGLGAVRAQARTEPAWSAALRIVAPAHFGRLAIGPRISYEFVDPAGSGSLNGLGLGLVIGLAF